MTQAATSKNIGLGFFDKLDSDKVESITDLLKAKDYLREVIGKKAAAAKPQNVAKAFKMVETSRNKTALLMGMWNFMLSHDGNKVIQSPR